MSLLHRLNLLEKFLILGTLGLMMSALPTYLTVSDSLHAIGHARQEARGVPPAQRPGGSSGAGQRPCCIMSSRVLAVRL